MFGTVLKIVSQVVNLLTQIITIVVNVRRVNEYENEKQSKKLQRDELHKNPAQYLQDHFNAHAARPRNGDDSLRSEASANKELHRTAADSTSVTNRIKF